MRFEQVLDLQARLFRRRHSAPLKPGRNPMCNLYSVTTNQSAIAALFRVMNRYVGNLPPVPGVFPDYPASVIRNDLEMLRQSTRVAPGKNSLTMFMV
jgi:hypothetical protein